MGRLLGLMLFCIGIGMVIGMLVTENVIIIISAGLCLPLSMGQTVMLLTTLNGIGGFVKHCTVN